MKNAILLALLLGLGSSAHALTWSFTTFAALLVLGLLSLFATRRRLRA